ncbi:hypothetical protein [Methyloversatilis sp.]|uniref:hypothetical protein n=1 Tax=Methyloversatilis sp. TaxID=2569862 RepID=UPI002736F0CE|nr:hypothetical protein [Methyloversatilis sp.]MDP2868937.1 hypothetical protein [Methyloversatilis sp.]MDP3288050.1 hypothetical protein [Methyloversatilis sp.]MDP3454632.1 hypothetical protein [Methyloversatilis sp.]MDP3580158.1 hypothetical protein [Methyloversatilis sp.]
MTPRPPMSEAELEQVLTRDYPGRSAQDVLAAATRLWRLADGDDFRIKPGNGSLVAERDWVFFSQMVRIVGDDTWTLTVSEANGVTTARLTLITYKRSTTVSSFGMTPTTQTSPRIGGPVKGSAIYDLFWARMDHLLGVRPDWMTCAEAEARVSAGTTWGNKDALCAGYSFTDAAP